MLWLYENRATITKEHGLVGKRVAEVTQKAGEVWKAMGPAEKKYENLAASGQGPLRGGGEDARRFMRGTMTRVVDMPSLAT